MNSNHLPPTELEWANANVEVIRVSGARIVGLKKTIERDDAAYAFVRIDGASDSTKTLELKVRDAMNNSAIHTFVFIDELGELYFRGMEESLRPVMTAPEITTLATAQNFHSKRRTDNTDEREDRERALLRRFSRIIPTANPSEGELLRFLARRTCEWGLLVDHPSTLRLLAKSVDIKQAAFRSPNTNAFVERFIQTLQQECLDYFVVFGQEHMDHIVGELVSHYHEERPHQSKDNGVLKLPVASSNGDQKSSSSDSSSPDSTGIECRQRLGGLLKHYRRMAA